MIFNASQLQQSHDRCYVERTSVPTFPITVYNVRARDIDLEQLRWCLFAYVSPTKRILWRRPIH
jgi:hypothetical protein